MLSLDYLYLVIVFGDIPPPELNAPFVVAGSLFRGRMRIRDPPELGRSDDVTVAFALDPSRLRFGARPPHVRLPG